VFCIYLRTNSELCHLQHKLIGFYNRDENCLQRGTDWGFKFESFNGVKRKGDEDKKGVKEKQQCANNEDTKVIITFLCHHTVGPVAQSV